MDVSRSKLVGLAIALGYLAVSILMGGWHTKDVVALCLILLLPLALIWFPDEISDTFGPFRWGGQSDRESPPVLLSALGWIFLFLGSGGSGGPSWGYDSLEAALADAYKQIPWLAGTPGQL